MILRGDDLPQTKLTEEDIRDIERILRESPKNHAGYYIDRHLVQRLALEYDVHKNTIYRIKYGTARR